MSVLQCAVNYCTDHVRSAGHRRAAENCWFGPSSPGLVSVFLIHVSLLAGKEPGPCLGHGQRRKLEREVTGACPNLSPQLLGTGVLGVKVGIARGAGVGLMDVGSREPSLLGHGWNPSTGQCWVGLGWPLRPSTQSLALSIMASSPTSWKPGPAGGNSGSWPLLSEGPLSTLETHCPLGALESLPTEGF